MLSPTVNPTLLQLAREKIARNKYAFVPAQPDPGQQGGPPPGLGQPTPQGMPPGTAGPVPGGMPPGQMDPSMGGMPGPMDPAAMGGMPPGGQSPGPPGMSPSPSQAQPANMGAGGKPKFDPLVVDHRLYNMQQQITALLNALDVQIPPGALVMPPGSVGAPPAEHALPGGQGDAGQQQQQPGGGAIQPVGPMEGAGQIQGSPVGGLTQKAANDFMASIDNPVQAWSGEDLLTDSDEEPAVKVATVAPVAPRPLSQNAAAIAALFRRKTT